MLNNIFNQRDRKFIDKQNICLSVVGVLFGVLSYYFDNVFGVFCSFVFGIMFGLIFNNYIYLKKYEEL